MSLRARAFGLLAIAAGLSTAALIPACSTEPEGVCVPNEQFFAEQVWGSVISPICLPCHNPQGLAKDTQMVFKASSEAGFLEANMLILKDVASFEKDGVSRILLKPTQTISHEGGQVITKGSKQYQVLEEMVARYKEPAACEADAAAFYADVALATPKETLRKAALSLASRLPTAEETASVEAGGEDALRAALASLMTEEGFFTRLREIYLDIFLTDRYLGSDDAVGLLDGEEFYDREWYEALDDPSLIDYYGARDGDDLIRLLRSHSNRGVAREPVELVVHVVRESRPFTEILTADYMMVNPFSSRTFGMTGLTFKNDADPSEFVEGRLEGFPHAGVLTSPVFLNRFPTTTTNRNRHRARMVYQFFLGTDILKTAEQPIDATTISDFNPTMNNPSCTVCHANIDPIAGAFHNFDDMGRYDPNDAWLEDMRPPGFGDEAIPYEEFPTSLQWLGDRIGKDPRFPLSVVFTVYTGLTGQRPLVAPTDQNDPTYASQFDAYLAQYTTFNAIAKDFVAANSDFKVAVMGVLMSPYYRAKNALSLDPARAEEVSELGMGHLLTPEQLHRKLIAVLGYPWRESPTSADKLLGVNDYRLLYGGIDSNGVTKRVLEPNGIMANIADRMANEMACYAVPRDFAKPKDERLLFPEIDVSYEPMDKNGFVVEPAVLAIRQTIQSLFYRVLGEERATDDPEIEAAYQIFLATWQEGQEGLADPDPEKAYPIDLPGDCRAEEEFWTGAPLAEDDQIRSDETYVIRSWMAVVSYLLSDYDFLYE